MKIGFDLDKIFINTPPFIPSAVINKFYKARDNGVLLYRIPHVPEQLLRKALHTPILRQPIKDNFAILQRLANDKENKLYLISSRFKFLEPETQRLIKKYKFDEIFDKLYFNYNNDQPHEFKNNVLQKLNLDIFIDDDLSLVRYVAKQNPDTAFYWLDEHAKAVKFDNNITAAKNLEEIFKKIIS